MVKPGIKRQLFEDKKASGTPILMSNLSQTDNGLIFFNTFRGSKLQEASTMSFQASELSDIKLSHLKGEKNGTFTVKGKVKWVDAVKQREVNDKRELLF